MKLTFIAGTGEDMHGCAIKPDTLAMALANIRTRLARVYGGFTELDHVGGWINGAGRMVMESGKTWVIFADDNDQERADRMSQYIRDELKQESVGVAVEPAAIRWAAEDAFA